MRIAKDFFMIFFSSCCKVLGLIANCLQLSRHIRTVHEGNKPSKCDVCDYSCSQKRDLNQHVASVHVTFVSRAALERVTLIDMMHLFMKEKIHSNAIFVTTGFLKMVI